MGKFYPLYPPLRLPDLLLGGQELGALPYLIHEFDAPRTLDVADESLTQTILVELHLQAGRPAVEENLAVLFRTTRLA